MSTVHEVETMVAEAAEKLVAAGIAVAAEAGAKPKSTLPKEWFAEADAFAEDAAARARPLVMQSIADDEEEFDELQKQTEDLVNAAELAMAVLDRAMKYVRPILLTILGA